MALEQAFLVQVLKLGLLSFAYGVMVILLDLIIFSIFGRSLLNIKYQPSFPAVARIVILWPAGAAIVGLIGGSTSVFNLKDMISAPLFIAISWPLLITNIVQKSNQAAGSKELKPAEPGAP